MPRGKPEYLKRKRIVKELRAYSVCDFDGPVEELIDELKSYPKGAYIEASPGSGHELSVIQVLIITEESEDNYNKRILRHKRNLLKEKQANLAREKRELERLKKKFGECMMEHPDFYQKQDDDYDYDCDDVRHYCGGCGCEPCQCE